MQFNQQKWLAYCGSAYAKAHLCRRTDQFRDGGCLDHGSFRQICATIAQKLWITYISQWEYEALFTLSDTYMWCTLVCYDGIWISPVFFYFILTRKTTSQPCSTRRLAWVMCWGVSVWGLNAALEKLHVNPQELKGLPSLTHELEKIPGGRCSLVNGSKKGWKMMVGRLLSEWICVGVFILYFNFVWAVIPKCPQHTLLLHCSSWVATWSYSHLSQFAYR